MAVHEIHSSVKSRGTPGDSLYIASLYNDSQESGEGPRFLWSKRHPLKTNPSRIAPRRLLQIILIEREEFIPSPLHNDIQLL